MVLAQCFSSSWPGLQLSEGITKAERSAVRTIRSRSSWQVPQFLTRTSPWRYQSVLTTCQLSAASLSDPIEREKRSHGDFCDLASEVTLHHVYWLNKKKLYLVWVWGGEDFDKGKNTRKRGLLGAILEAGHHSLLVGINLIYFIK